MEEGKRQKQIAGLLHEDLTAIFQRLGTGQVTINLALAGAENGSQPWQNELAHQQVECGKENHEPEQL